MRAFTIKTFVFILYFANIAFADICDSGYEGESYLRDLEYSPEIVCGSNLYDHLKLNIPDTFNLSIDSNGYKDIYTITMIGDNCFEVKNENFDNAGKIISSFSYIEKGANTDQSRSFKLQITFNGVIRNINYGNTPCEFTVIEPSGDSAIFHFNGTENDPEDKKLKEKYPNVVYTFLSGQAYECKKYKEYKEYTEFVNSLGK